MNSTNGFKCAICHDTVCSDPTKDKSINLTCGHAFGKSCLRKWVESSNQKKCPLCNNPLTDNKIQEINKIPLHERVVIFSQKVIKLFGRTILWLAPSFVNGVVIAALARSASGAAGVALGAVLSAGVAAGTIGAAAGVDRASAVVGGAVSAAAGSVGLCAGAVGFTAKTVGLTAGAVGGAAGVIGVTAGVIGDTAGAVGAVTTVTAIGAAFGTDGAIYVASGLGAGVAGALGADAVYRVQEMDPVVL